MPAASPRPAACSGSASGRQPAVATTRPRSPGRSATRSIVAGVDHVGLGSDFDGAVPVPFDATGLVVLTDALLEAGFADDDIAKIMGGNVRRLLSETLPRAEGDANQGGADPRAAPSAGSASIGLHLRSGVPVTDLAPAPPDADDVAPAVADLDTIVSLAKRRGFVFPSSRDLRRHQRGLGLRPARRRAEEQRQARLVAGDGPGARRHRRARRGDPHAPAGVGHVGPRRVVQRPAGRVPDRPPALPPRRAARRRGPDGDRAARPDDRRTPRPEVPGRRRPAVGAAPVQPDVQDVHGPGRGGRGGHLPAPGDGPGLVRQLQERPPVDAQEAAVRDRPDRQDLPQRDQPGQLRLPDARVRADGDAVLRPPRGRGRGRVRGVAAAAPGLVRAATA